MWYIEADCGQPNFGRLPGSLSLLKLNISDGIHPEVEKVEKEVFLNTADPASDPDLYISVLKLLLNSCKGKDSVLLINTCGWVEGLGAGLISQLVEECSRITPNFQVIEMQSNK